MGAGASSTQEAVANATEEELGNVLASLPLEQLQKIAEVVQECDGSEAQAANAPQKGKVRREGVSAQSMSDDLRKNWQKPFHEKPPEVREKIKTIISSNDKLQTLFGHLTDDAVFEVIDAMASKSVEVGSNVIVQGQDGDNFYIVDEGNLDVYVKRGDSDACKVLELGPGGMFGELALLYNAPRAATVTATTAVELWYLDQASFQIMLSTAENVKTFEHESFLSEIDIFKGLTKYEIEELSEKLQAEEFDDGEVIVKEGDEADKFYLIQDGEAKVFISGPGGETEIGYYQNPGEFFGEIGILTNSARAATVRAFGIGGCSTLSIGKDDFRKILAPMMAPIREHIKSYPKRPEEF